MKGIVMAGGLGTRLYPTTRVVNKALLPVYDKPMIYYPISLLLMAGVREILLCSSSEELESYKKLLGDGSRFGIRILYRVERNPAGTVGAFLNCRDYIGDEAFAMALGDNIFFGPELENTVRSAAERFAGRDGAHIFCRYVEDPREFGVVELDAKGRILALESKPQVPKSHYAVTGLFFFRGDVSDFVESTRDSEGNLIAFPQLLKHYIAQGRLHSVLLNEDIRWYDAGTPRRLFEASAAVKAYQESCGKYVGSIEETAYDCGLIDREQLAALSADLLTTEYGRHLSELAAQK